MFFLGTRSAVCGGASIEGETGLSAFAFILQITGTHRRTPGRELRPIHVRTGSTSRARMARSAPAYQLQTAIDGAPTLVLRAQLRVPCTAMQTPCVHSHLQCTHTHTHTHTHMHTQSRCVCVREEEECARVCTMRVWEMECGVFYSGCAHLT
jgi:hypothetical protein